MNLADWIPEDQQQVLPRDLYNCSEERSKSNFNFYWGTHFLPPTEDLSKYDLQKTKEPLQCQDS